MEMSPLYHLKPIYDLCMVTIYDLVNKCLQQTNINGED